MRIGVRQVLLSAGIMLLASLPPAARAAEAEKRASSQANGTQQDTFRQQVVPLLGQYCVRCHAGARARGGLALDTYKTEADALKNPPVWDLVVQLLRSGEMPPRGRTKPTPAEVQRIAAWVEQRMGTGLCATNRNPGRVTLRRLNRAEYNNTIRDLIGVPFQPAEDFPADDVGYGFDNIGDVLSLPPLLMEKYLAAAERIVTLARSDPEVWKRIVFELPQGKNSEDGARKVLEKFARRAFRRPVRPGELDRLMGLVRLAQEQDDGFEQGIELALEAILTSPHFLFRVERDRRLGSRNTVLTLGEFELATRLSYFIWSSMPDDELLAQAGPGSLREGGTLEQQVLRMLNDPKSRALVENFAGQWLELRNLKTAMPDPGTFPAFDESLRAAMLKETELFFEAIMREDRSILDFLDADFAFVNERLARHYGIPGIQGEQFQRVPLTGTGRGGILTQASFLTLTSNPTRTSPVKRGKWILENLLGTPPPPPPPDAGQLSEDKAVVESGSLRQRMEQHRANQSCAVCHDRMDPLGFGFENFDGIGAWRTRDGQFPIDPSGTLPSGQSFQGPAELKAILKARASEFSRCLTEKMLTYALGRGLESYDKCAVDQIGAALAKNNYRFSTLVIEIVKSDPFQKRRTDTGAKP